MIVFNDVTKNYGANVGLTNASVHINSGDFVFLVGPSGAGKTTFIRLILKEIEPDGGQIVVAGKDITRLSRREIPKLRQKIGMVFQDFRLLEKKTVYENVAFAMEVLHKNKKEIQDRVPYVLKLVDIADKADRYPNELSAGEQQRVGIARALANKPRIMICDEPTGNLDPVTAMDIMNLLERINRNGTTILMVTHAKDIVDKMNKRVVAIENGHIVRDEQGRYGYKSEKTEAIEGDSVFGNSLAEDDSVFAHSYAEGDDVFGVKPLFEEDKKNTLSDVFGGDIKNTLSGIFGNDFEKHEEMSNTMNIVNAYLDEEEDQ